MHRRLQAGRVGDDDAAGGDDDELFAGGAHHIARFDADAGFAVFIGNDINNIAIHGDAGAGHGGGHRGVGYGIEAYGGEGQGVSPGSAC